MCHCGCALQEEISKSTEPAAQTGARASIAANSYSIQTTIDTPKTKGHNEFGYLDDHIAPTEGNSRGQVTSGKEYLDVIDPSEEIPEEM